jgi:hypothetical protein
MRLKLFSIATILILAINSCSKCYECTLKCGTCTKTGQQTLAGCDGDINLNGVRVDTWKVHWESQGYSCVYNNPPAQEACSAAAKKTYEDQSIPA